VHVLPIAAVVDVELVVLGGGIGANGDLLLGPVRERLAEQLPFPPRVEVSTLGDAAVLTGALAIGLTSALEHAFTAVADLGARARAHGRGRPRRSADRSVVLAPGLGFRLGLGLGLGRERGQVAIDQAR
jgi:hypothetical protein